MKKLFTIFFMLLTLRSLTAFADDQVNYKTISLIINPLTINDAEVKSISFSGNHQIKNITVQAEGISRDSTLEVMVNGEVKGTIYAPGKDPSYIVTIQDIAHSIEFRHRSGGAMRILQVHAVISENSTTVKDPGINSHFNQDEVRALALLTIKRLDYLEQHVSPQEFEAYLFPIKKSAGMVYVMSSAHGNLSRKTLIRLVLLMDQIDLAHTFLEKLMQFDNVFDAVVDLLTVRERIQDSLD